MAKRQFKTESKKILDLMINCSNTSESIVYRESSRKRNSTCGFFISLNHCETGFPYSLNKINCSVFCFRRI